ncbi:alpha/beta fold hydrolase [Streptomyces sp. NPDC006307]|uniref:thioesterase II family protein n=1 Tax=Streptomyces sp. NPDC006307 TaxID=3156748 RepID=UPI0033BF1880
MKPTPLVLLHHSGGSAQVFAPLIAALPPTITPIPLELPGRGRRWREEPLTTAEAAVTDLAEQLSDAGVTGHFALFGHSMGAYLALALAAKLERDASPAQCTILFASANAGPQCAVPLFEGDPLEADDEDVLRTGARFGGLDPQILAHAQLRQRTARILRADFGVCDTFVRNLSHNVTESPLVVCYGTEDSFSQRQLTMWRCSSASTTDMAPFPGDHFYLTDQASALADLITRRLTATVAQPA